MFSQQAKLLELLDGEPCESVVEEVELGPFLRDEMEGFGGEGVSVDRGGDGRNERTDLVESKRERLVVEVALGTVHGRRRQRRGVRTSNWGCAERSKR